MTAVDERMPLTPSRERRYHGDVRLLTDRYLEAVDLRLRALFDDETQRWAGRHPELSLGLQPLSTFVLDGGKRLRPRFAYLGFVAAGGRVHDAQIIELGAALEMLHAFALVHDDVMDGSDRRRHAPTLHQHFQAEHDARGWHGEQRRVGEGVAVLMGDLCFAYSIRLQHGLAPSVRSVLDEMRTELHIGQFLDLMSAATRRYEVEQIRSITRYKTSTYTVERPLQLGAILADGDTPPDVLLRYGRAVGEAFQHCDDLLGVFGDPAVTGKPRFDDLMSGKATMLVHAARRAAESSSFGPLDRLGTDEFRAEDAVALAGFMVNCGAVAAVERRIDALVDEAVTELDSTAIPASVVAELAALARQAGRRVA